MTDESTDATVTATTANTANAALRANDITRSFGDVSVLDGVSLTVGRGELVAVVGPNGSGKSTLMETLAGVRSPDSGVVTVASNGKTSGGGRRDIGYLPQRPAFRGGFTARDTLEFYARFVDDAGSKDDTEGTDVDADVKTTLERVGLVDVAGRKVGSLSGGMTRLLGLGQAILGRPSVLVLDEPGSGLDPAMVERLFAVLRSLADDGTGVVVTSHNLSAVETYADRVALLDRGRFVVSGTPAQLLDSTGTESLVEAFLTTVRADERESTVRAGLTTEGEQ